MIPGLAAPLDPRWAELRFTGDRAIRNELVEEYRGLAIHLAQRYAGRGEPTDDLIQVAMLGLVKAVERFDATRGLQFSTFATPTILGELRRHFRDRSWALVVPRRIKERRTSVRHAALELAQQLGRTPTVQEVAAHTSLSPDAVIETLEASALFTVGSIDAPTGTGHSIDPQLAERGYEHIEQTLEVANLISCLPPREREIVRLRFYEELTQAEIAERVGISQMHVSRLLAQSLAKLRQMSQQADLAANS